ncbi:MAG TPA: lamin tail domain-containing protein [Steroidobacteraceae bacterium]|nr:lamin tail domain-containing protein [Steroidobacteraceae bacterium]
MQTRTRIFRALLCGVALTGAATAATASSLPDVRITEYMYKNENSPGEFVQFTNLGSTPVDMSGWSEDDSTDDPGVHSLSGLGTLQPGESGILAEATQSSFDSAWDLSSSVPYVEEDGTDNLGKSDAIYLFDPDGDVVDELQYGGYGVSSGTSGPKTDGVAAVPDSLSAIGADDWADWELLTAGEDGAIQAYGESDGDVASPGYSSFAVSPVPLPPAGWMLAAGLALLAATLAMGAGAPCAAQPVEA